MTYGTINSYNLVKINGADASTFLQGQLTNDVTLLDTQWHFTGYCSPKGRLIALLKIWKTDTNEFYALLSKDLVESTVKRLRMFVMRSNVEITILNKSIAGFNSTEDLIKAEPNYCELIDQSNESSVTVLGDDNFLLKVSNRYLTISELEKTKQSHDSDWQENNIIEGLPQINSATTELFIPQMINLDLLNGINFKKGCYTGQEIVARMHYLGKLKQRMFVCQISAPLDKIRDGEKVFISSSSNINEQKTVGNIVSSAENLNHILAVIRLDNIDNDLILENGEKIEILDPQPYQIPY